MTQTLLARWHSTPDKDTTAIVIPDGCRDLIMRLSPGEKPHWFISALVGHTYTVSTPAGVVMKGFRLKPGVRIDEERLLASVQNLDYDGEDFSDQINSFSVLSPSIVEALDCLACDVGPVADVATELGVSQRSLQRLLLRETGRPPSYWLLLARVRKAARAVFEPIPLAEVALIYGYADQAHMSREFKRWLNISPSKLRRGSAQSIQLNEHGYG
jgi:AraC-like DNA-binding protein